MQHRDTQYDGRAHRLHKHTILKYMFKKLVHDTSIQSYALLVHKHAHDCVVLCTKGLKHIYACLLRSSV